jgi:hypothetical protein
MSVSRIFSPGTGSLRRGAGWGRWGGGCVSDIYFWNTGHQLLGNKVYCSETTLTGETRFHISTPQGIWTQVPSDGKQRVSSLDQWNMVRMKWDCRLSTGLTPSSRLRQLWSWKEVLQWAWNRDRKAVWDQVGLSHCQHEGLGTVWDEACCRRGCKDDQSRWGH